MAKLKKRDDGRYQKSFTYEGKRYCVYSTSQKDLDEKVLQKLTELKERKSKHDNPPLDKYYSAFTELRKNIVKESTIRNQTNWYNWAANVKIDGIRLGDMRIRDINTQDIKFVQKEMINNPKLSASSINDSLHHVSHVFNEAVKDETIDKNPCRCLNDLAREQDKPKATKTIHRALSKEETKQFIEITTEKEPFYLNAFKLMLLTGIRMGELGSLTSADCDFKTGLMSINKTISRGVVSSYMVNPSPKTEASNRVILMNDEVMQTINNQKALLRSTFGLRYMPYLFPARKGGLLVDTSFNRAIERVTEKMGIEHLTSHAFRATFATRFIEQRPHEFKVLSEILGHASVEITLDLYAKVMAETKQRAMKEIVIAM